MALRPFNSYDQTEVWFDPAHIFHMTWYPTARPPMTSVTVIHPVSGASTCVNVNHSPTDILAPGPE